jgi:hypothetical protein
MENTQEMFILSKYKYIRYLAKSAEKVVTSATVSSMQANLPKAMKSEEVKKGEICAKQAEIDAKEKKKAEKLAKQELMKKMCQPSKKKEEKVKFVEKVKYVNDTPVGEKKGKEILKI